MAKNNLFYGGLRGNGLREVTREGKSSMRTYVAGPKGVVSIETGVMHRGHEVETAWFVVGYDDKDVGTSKTIARGAFGKPYTPPLPDALTFGTRLHEALSNIAAGCRDPQGVAQRALRDLFGG
jgi:hypothetical protein